MIPRSPRCQIVRCQQQQQQLRIAQSNKNVSLVIKPRTNHPRCVIHCIAQADVLKLPKPVPEASTKLNSLQYLQSPTHRVQAGLWLLSILKCPHWCTGCSDPGAHPQVPDVSCIILVSSWYHPLEIEDTSSRSAVQRREYPVPWRRIHHRQQVIFTLNLS